MFYDRYHPGGYCPGGYCPGGVCPGGNCPGDVVRGDIVLIRHEIVYSPIFHENLGGDKSSQGQNIHENAWPYPFHAPK